MTIRIDGGTVVGWSGAHHELIPDGSVLIDGDSIGYVGADRTKRADKIIDASGKLVCPGFINLHVHSQLNVGDYLITDASKRDYWSANYLVFGAPGTLNEFTIAYDEGKVIGVLEGSDGIADHIREVLAFCNKTTHATVLFETEPEALIDKCLQALESRRS